MHPAREMLIVIVTFTAIAAMIPATVKTINANSMRGVAAPSHAETGGSLSASSGAAARRPFER